MTLSHVRRVTLNSPSTIFHVVLFTFFLFRDVERELFPCLRRFGMAFYAYNPVGSSFPCLRSSSTFIPLPKIHSAFLCVSARRWTIDRKTSIWRQRERNHSVWSLWRHGPVGWRVSMHRRLSEMLSRTAFFFGAPLLEKSGLIFRWRTNYIQGFPKTSDDDL